MLNEYSIEQRAEKIFDSRTKEYFSEVLSSYVAGNYRSAVVMLWSVTICDLLFKLEKLSEIYEDKKAIDILNNFKEEQQDINNKSSAWELELVQSIAKQTQLIDKTELLHLEGLQKERHLAAHPIVDGSFQLYQPNRETVRALIRNSLDSVLNKSPILSTQITEMLVIDLNQISNIIIDKSKIKTYLESKYFFHFNAETEKKVFKVLWKFVFKLENEECKNNREINYKALSILYQRNPKQFDTQIDNDKATFSKISKNNDTVVYLVRFLSQKTHLYKFLEKHAQEIIKATAEQDVTARCLACFIHEDLQKHANELEEWMKNNNESRIERLLWDEIRSIADSSEWSKTVIHLANQHYTASLCYDDANFHFAEAIQPFLKYYDSNDCIELMKGIASNSQTTGRNSAHNDHSHIKKHIISLDTDFNFSEYEKIFR